MRPRKNCFTYCRRCASMLKETSDEDIHACCAVFAVHGNPEVVMLHMSFVLDFVFSQFCSRTDSCKHIGRFRIYVVDLRICENIIPCVQNRNKQIKRMIAMVQN